MTLMGLNSAKSLMCRATPRGGCDPPAEALFGVIRRQGFHPIPLLLRASFGQSGRFRNDQVGSPGGNPGKPPIAEALI